MSRTSRTIHIVMVPASLILVATSCSSEPSTAAIASTGSGEKADLGTLLVPHGPSAQPVDPFLRCVPPPRKVYLPWAERQTRYVGQAWNGEYSHKGEHAIDVFQALGEPVLAADDGIVTQVIDGFEDIGRASEDDVFHANYVELDHGDGRFSQYLHLQKGTILVREGQPVARGAPLGKTGNSGFSSRPHVHFAVVDVYGKSVPACLEGVSGGVPSRGFAISTNPPQPAGTPPSQPVAPSTISRDTFRGDGVTLFTALSARRWSVADPVTLSGRAATPGAIVAYEVTPRDSHLRVSRAMQIESDPRGHFTLKLQLPAIDGRYELRIFEVRDGQTLESRGVPIVVRGNVNARRADPHESATPPASIDATLRPVDATLSGPWHDAYPGGHRAEQGSHERGQPVGPWLGWYETGASKYQGGFADGRPHGPWTVWYENGKKRWDRSYDHGSPTGVWRAWDDGGRLLYVGEYLLDDGTGSYVERFEDGHTRQEGRYVRGVKHGVWTMHHPSGRLAATTSYQNGRQDGLARAWFENGQPKSEASFRNGLLVGWSRGWFANGRRRSEQQFRAGHPDGTGSVWFENGQRQMSMTYVRGLIEGTMTIWNEQGKLIATSRYHEGVQMTEKVRPTSASTAPR